MERVTLFELDKNGYRSSVALKIMPTGELYIDCLAWDDQDYERESDWTVGVVEVAKMCDVLDVEPDQPVQLLDALAARFSSRRAERDLLNFLKTHEIEVVSRTSYLRFPSSD